MRKPRRNTEKGSKEGRPDCAGIARKHARESGDDEIVESNK